MNTHAPTLLRLLTTSVVLALGGAIASAQTLTVVQPSNHIVSPRASDLHGTDKVNGPNVIFHHAVPPNSHGGSAGGPDTAVQTNLGPLINATAGVNFDGLSVYQGGYIPSDNNIAVGPTRVMETVNAAFAIYDKSGNLLSGPTALKSLWTGLGGDCANNNGGDTVVQYDRAADRWIMTQLGSLAGPYSECIAVSTTNDPAGTYNLYSYSFGSNLNDYPKFGVWSTASNSAYLGTYNLFANGSSFAGAEICAYDRAAMLAGANAVGLCFTGISGASFLPVDVDGPTPPVDGTPAYFMDLSGSSLGVYKLTPNFAAKTATLSSFTTIGVASYSQAPSAVQPNTTETLDPLSDRLMYRLAFRMFPDHEAIVVNHSVAAGSSSGVRWYELRAPVSASGNFSMFQQGTFAPDSNYRWMGSAAMDQSGDIAIGYSVSNGSTTFPAVRYTGRTPGDPAGTMETEASIKEGAGSQTGYTRWGDYSAMRIDPSDDCTFWYVNEYLPVTSSYGWYTHIGAFKFSGCGVALTSTTTTLGAAPASPSTYGTPVTFTATVTPSGATGTVTFQDGGTTLGTGALSNGTATYSTSSLAGGAHSITASYGGDSNYSGSSSASLPYSVSPAGTTTTLVPTPSSSTFGQSVTLKATVSPSATGTVTFFDGGAQLSTVTLTGGTASYATSTLTAGTHSSMKATYNGSANYAGSSGGTSVTVGQAATSTLVSSSSPTSTVGQSVTFTATVTSSANGATGTVTFLDGGTTIGTGNLSGGKATYSTSSLAAGSHTITASYGGDSNFVGSTSGPITQTVKSATPDFSISASPGNITVKSGGTVSYNVTITPVNGFTGSVTFQAASVPSGPNPAFSINAPYTMTVPTGGLSRGTYTITITATSGSLNHSTTVSLRVR